jgi:zinc transporter, ZIP family
VAEAFVWGLLAAGSLLLGAMIVFAHQPTPRTLGLIMAFGAGVLLSAVAYELVQESVIVAGGTGWTALGLLVGAACFTLGDTAISRAGYEHRKDLAGSAQSASALAIVLGIVLDGVPESAVIGLTLLDSGEIGVSMLVAVFVSNIPESIAATQGLLSGGWTRGRLVLMWVAIALVSAFASAAGYALLDGADPSAVGFVQAFAGGAVLTMLATTMMPEAYEHAGRAAGPLTTFGFAVAFGLSWAA